MRSFSPSRRELLIILGLILLTIAAWSFYTLYKTLGKPAAAEYAQAEIIYNGTVAEKVYLDKDLTFSIDGLPNVVFEVKDHKIAFIQSDCPDKICIHTGWLESGGHVAACLPNKVILRIVEDEEASIDAVAR